MGKTASSWRPFHKLAPLHFGSKSPMTLRIVAELQPAAWAKRSARAREPTGSPVSKCSWIIASNTAWLRKLGALPGFAESVFCRPIKCLSRRRVRRAAKYNGMKPLAATRSFVRLTLHCQLNTFHYSLNISWKNLFFTRKKLREERILIRRNLFRKPNYYELLKTFSA